MYRQIYSFSGHIFCWDAPLVRLPDAACKSGGFGVQLLLWQV